MSTSERAGLTLRGVLFDLDGTLVNSEPFWAAAQTRLVHAFGGRLIQPTLQGVPLDRVRGPHRSRSQDRSDARGRVLRAGRDAVGGVVVARDHPDAPAVRSAG